MATPHVSQFPLEGSLESTLRQALTAGLIADADFATDETTTLANIAARNAKAHVAMQPLLEKLYHAVKVGFRHLGATVMISDTATIFAETEETWGAGFAL